MASDMQLEYIVDADYSALSELERAARAASRGVVRSAGQMDTAIDKNGNSISRLDVEMGRFVDSSGRMREANGRFVRGLSETDKALGKTEESTERVGKKFDAFGFKLNDVSANLGFAEVGLGGATGAGLAFVGAIVAGTTALIAFGAAQSQVLVDIERLAKIGDTTTDSIQVLAQAAQDTGINMEGIASILQDVGDRVGEFTRLGEGEFVDIYEEFFRPIGIGAKELEAMRPEEILSKLHEEMQKAGKTSKEQIATFEQLASDSWRLTEVWGMSKEELRALKDQMERKGQLVSEEDIARAKEIDNKIDDLGKNFQALKTKILLGLEEPIKGAIGFVNKLIGKLNDLFTYDSGSELSKLRGELALVNSELKVNQAMGQPTLLNESKRKKILDQIAATEAKIAAKKVDTSEKDAGVKPTKKGGDIDLPEAYKKKLDEKKLSLQKAFASEREIIELSAKESEAKIREAYVHEADTMADMLKKNEAAKNKKLQDIADRESAKRKMLSDKEKRERERLAQEMKQAEDKAKGFIDYDATELDKIKASAVEKISLLDEYRRKDLISEKLYQEAKAAIVADSESQRLKAIDAAREKAASLGGGVKSPIRDIDKGEADRIKQLDELRKQDLINDQLYQETKTAIQVDAERQRNEAITAARQKVAGLSGGSDDPIQRLYIEQAEKMAVLDEFREQELISDAEFQAAKNQIVKDASDGRIEILRAEQAANIEAASSFMGAMSGSFSSLASVLAEAKGEQSSAYKTAIAAQKSFALASASLSLGQAVAQAFSNPAKTTAEKFADAASITTALGNVISTIGSVSYGGGKAMGGSVQAGKMYEVGERGVEMFSSGGRNFMIPDRAGNITPNNKLDNGSSISVVQNFSVEASATYDPQAMQQLMQATKAQTMQVLQQQSLQGGILRK